MTSGKLGQGQDFVTWGFEFIGAPKVRQPGGSGGGGGGGGVPPEKFGNVECRRQPFRGFGVCFRQCKREPNRNTGSREPPPPPPTRAAAGKTLGTGL